MIVFLGISIPFRWIVIILFAVYCAGAFAPIFFSGQPVQLDPSSRLQP